jgi:hypothetical protein
MGIDQAQQGRVAVPKDLMNCWLGQMTFGLDYNVLIAANFCDFVSELCFTTLLCKSE